MSNLPACWPCAHCLQPLRSACVTAACGHGFHEQCAAALSVDATLVCPECAADGDEDPADDEEPWRTFWEVEDGAATPDPVVVDDIHITSWRRVARLERRVADVAAQAAAARELLTAERKLVTRHTSIESGLKRDISANRKALDECRVRSLSAVVAHGAANCHTELLKCRGDVEVHERLRSLRHAHGHALHELFGVQQQALALMQTTYAGRLAAWRGASGGVPTASKHVAPYVRRDTSSSSSSSSSGGGGGGGVSSDAAAPSGGVADDGGGGVGGGGGGMAARRKAVISGRAYKPMSFAQSHSAAQTAQADTFLRAHASEGEGSTDGEGGGAPGGGAAGGAPKAGAPKAGARNAVNVAAAAAAVPPSLIERPPVSSIERPPVSSELPPVSSSMTTENAEKLALSNEVDRLREENRQLLARGGGQSSVPRTSVLGRVAPRFPPSSGSSSRGAGLATGLAKKAGAGGAALKATAAPPARSFLAAGWRPPASSAPAASKAAGVLPPAQLGGVGRAKACLPLDSTHSSVPGAAHPPPPVAAPAAVLSSWSGNIDPPVATATAALHPAFGSWGFKRPAPSAPSAAKAAASKKRKGAAAVKGGTGQVLTMRAFFGSGSA